MKKIRLFLLFLISILTPLLLITTVMRTALTPLFINIEYRLPNFPPDSFGFTRDDRLKWANDSISFLLGKLPLEEYSKLKFADGSELFNARELSHMIDVRNLTSKMLAIWWILLAFFALIFILGYLNNWLLQILKFLIIGAKITILFIIGVLLYVLLNFEHLFILFHQLFFEGDSWLFYMSDTLIRLFPIRFWQDLFIYIGGFSFLISIFLIFASKRLLREH